MHKNGTATINPKFPFSNHLDTPKNIKGGQWAPRTIKSGGAIRTISK